MNLRKDHYRFSNLFERHSWQGLEKRGDRSVSSSCSTFVSDAFLSEGWGTWLWNHPVARGSRPEESTRRLACADREVQRALFPPFSLLQLARGASGKVWWWERAAPTFRRFFFLFTVAKSLSVVKTEALGSACCRRAPGTKLEKIKTLSGGSLGSRVDEERSQLRELM